jgi:hypothetical protein
VLKSNRVLSHLLEATRLRLLHFWSHNSSRKAAHFVRLHALFVILQSHDLSSGAVFCCLQRRMMCVLVLGWSENLLVSASHISVISHGKWHRIIANNQRISTNKNPFRSFSGEINTSIDRLLMALRLTRRLLADISPHRQQPSTFCCNSHCCCKYSLDNCQWN